MLIHLGLSAPARKHWGTLIHQKSCRWKYMKIVNRHHHMCSSASSHRNTCVLNWTMLWAFAISLLVSGFVCAQQSPPLKMWSDCWDSSDPHAMMGAGYQNHSFQCILNDDAHMLICDTLCMISQKRIMLQLVHHHLQLISLPASSILSACLWQMRGSSPGERSWSSVSWWEDAFCFVDILIHIPIQRERKIGQHSNEKSSGPVAFLLFLWRVSHESCAGQCSCLWRSTFVFGLQEYWSQHASLTSMTCRSWLSKVPQVRNQHSFNEMNGSCCYVSVCWLIQGTSVLPQAQNVGV